MALILCLRGSRRHGFTATISATDFITRYGPRRSFSRAALLQSLPSRDTPPFLHAYFKMLAIRFDAGDYCRFSEHKMRAFD